MTDELTGVWVRPSGGRVEITRDGEGWRSYVYLFRNGGTPGGEFTFDDEAKVRDSIRGLESDGYARDPDRAPDGVRNAREYAAKQWQSPGHVTGALVLFAVLMLIGIPLINSCS